MIYANPENYMGIDVSSATPLIASAPPESVDPNFLNSISSSATPGWAPAVLDTTRPNEAVNTSGGVSTVSPFFRPPGVFHFDPTMNQVNSEGLLLSRLLYQIDFYFSADNLARDTFLRRHMDESGWVPISVIAKFNRVASLSTDVDKIMQVRI